MQLWATKQIWKWQSTPIYINWGSFSNRGKRLSRTISTIYLYLVLYVYIYIYPLNFGDWAVLCLFLLAPAILDHSVVSLGHLWTPGAWLRQLSSPTSAGCGMGWVAQHFYIVTWPPNNLRYVHIAMENYGKWYMEICSIGLRSQRSRNGTAPLGMQKSTGEGLLTFHRGSPLAIVRGWRVSGLSQVITFFMGSSTIPSQPVVNMTARLPMEYQRIVHGMDIPRTWFPGRLHWYTNHPILNHIWYVLGFPLPMVIRLSSPSGSSAAGVAT